MTPHSIDFLGLVLSFGWLVGGVIFIRRWHVSAMVAGLGCWAILDVTGRLLARLDPERGWNPSDTIWTYTGWIGCIGVALFMVALRSIVVRLTIRRAS